MDKRAPVLGLAAWLPCVMLLCSCCLLEPERQPTQFPAGGISVAWSLRYPDGAEAFVNTYCTLVDEQLYQVLVDRRLLCVNVKTGSVEWVKDTTILAESDPVLVDDRLYMLEWYGDWPYDECGSPPSRIIRTGLGAESPVELLTATFGGMALVGRIPKLNEHNGTLYWGSMNWHSGGLCYGLLAFDPSADTTRSAEGISATPRVIYPTHYDIHTNIVFHGNLAIFVGIDRAAAQGGVPMERACYRVFAVDLETGELRWTQLPEYAYGAYCPGSLQLYRGLLYLFTMEAAACLDPADGRIIWENPELTGGDVAGPLFDGQRVYVANGGAASVIESLGGAMVVCADVTTGEVIWKDFCEETTFGTNPQRYGEKLFVPTGGSIAVYDASTGRRLYRDTSRHGDGYQLNRCVRYGDLMVVVGNYEIFAVDMSRS